AVRLRLAGHPAQQAVDAVVGEFAEYQPPAASFPLGLGPRDDEVGDADDEAPPRGGPAPGRLAAGEEIGVRPGGHRVLPAAGAGALVPERPAPGRLPVVHGKEGVAAAPDGVGEDVHLALLAVDAVEGGGDVGLGGAVGADGDADPAACGDLVGGVVDVAGGA